MTDNADRANATARRSFCLTDMSITMLIGGALAVSAILWLAILAVL